ncbi:hypothetical protein B0H15DRAFT_1016983 [Mycena belliarum]|uniref:Uncharacterized protein n=1 Tax=Mycena belliarum TaxID=1033014 RepID=A0AAD6UJ51_9AGAR|nr:hypothetical protein B0H15DRAFT_1016983 [Mycena belliae]
MSASPPASESTTPSLLRRFPTQKIASYIRFKTGAGAADKRPPIIFPPPSWSLEETQNNGAGASELPDEPSMRRDISEDDIHTEDAPEPHTFARRISALIDELPPPAPTTDADIGAVDPKGPPLHAAITADSKLMKWLSSENVMSGSIALGRQSVWSMLDRLNHQSAAHSSTKKEDDGKGDEREDEGVMMYAPLQPDADSQLELADSEVVLEYLDEPVEADKPDAADTKPPLSSSPQPEPLATGGVKPSLSRRKRKAKEHIHWVPSPTKISLQAMWWGYRLYLPPPVMKVLNNSHLAAAKRGAMITAALKWLLDKVPMMLLPPPLRPAMMVLKRLTPFLGYVGVFIAWSWTAIKARDKGEGVVLTATWLLPVALVPATLNREDFQRHPGGTPTDTKTSNNSTAPANPEAVKRAEPVKPDVAPKSESSTKPAPETETPHRKWASFLTREKSKGKADEVKQT